MIGTLLQVLYGRITGVPKVAQNISLQNEPLFMYMNWQSFDILTLKEKTLRLNLENNSSFKFIYYFYIEFKSCVTFERTFIIHKKYFLGGQAFIYL